MALPVRAAAAALSDLISKIPIQSETQKNVLSENISNISSAFNVDTLNHRYNDLKLRALKYFNLNYNT